jgi:hypothetical protein
MRGPYQAETPSFGNSWRLVGISVLLSGFVCCAMRRVTCGNVSSRSELFHRAEDGTRECTPPHDAGTSSGSRSGCQRSVTTILVYTICGWLSSAKVGRGAILSKILGRRAATGGRLLAKVSQRFARPPVDALRSGQVSADFPRRRAGAPTGQAGKV